MEQIKNEVTTIQKYNSIQYELFLWNRVHLMKLNTGIVKLRKNDSTMHSGFEAPAIGTVLSKNTTIKKNPDGTLSVTEGE